MKKQDTTPQPAYDECIVPGGARTVEELTRHNVELIARLEQAARERRSGMDRVVDLITDFCGSMAFVWVHLIWFGGWISANHLGSVKPFDPFPYPFLTLVVSLEAILLSTFILITQNRQSVIAERRNHLDLQINLLSEQENTKMLLILNRIAKKLDVHFDDPEVRMLEESARPERMAEQIEESLQPPGQPDAATPNAVTRSPA